VDPIYRQLLELLEKNRPLAFAVLVETKGSTLQKGGGASRCYHHDKSCHKSAPTRMSGPVALWGCRTTRARRPRYYGGSAKMRSVADPPNLPNEGVLVAIDDRGTYPSELKKLL
jgi:hypothetical protein